MVFKEVGTELPEVWTPEKKGDFIQGIFLKRKTDVGKNKANIYTLDLNGTKKSVWGSTVLDDKMDEVSEGDTIRITFEGFDESKTYHKYKVEKDDGDEED